MVCKCGTDRSVQICAHLFLSSAKVTSAMLLAVAVNQTGYVCSQHELELDEYEETPAVYAAFFDQDVSMLALVII